MIPKSLPSDVIRGWEPVARLREALTLSFDAWRVRPTGTLPILLRSLSSKMAIGRGAMAIQRQEQAVREKLVGYVFLASLAAVIAFILYNHIMMF